MKRDLDTKETALQLHCYQKVCHDYLELEMTTKMKTRSYSEEEILNKSLLLAMEWGKNWLQPIQKRLGKLYPKLSPGELDRYDSIARKAMEYGHSTVYKMAEVVGIAIHKKEFAVKFKAKYEWVSDENIGRCFSQGRYYAFKDIGF